MRQQVDDSSKLREGMDRIDAAQQRAIEALAVRVEHLTWVLAVAVVICVTSVIFMVGAR